VHASHNIYKYGFPTWFVRIVYHLWSGWGRLTFALFEFSLEFSGFPSNIMRIECNEFMLPSCLLHKLNIKSMIMKHIVIRSNACDKILWCNAALPHYNNLEYFFGNFINISINVILQEGSGVWLHPFCKYITSPPDYYWIYRFLCQIFIPIRPGFVFGIFW
jgi:hypothetical protein